MIDDLRVFLAHAVQLEANAAEGYRVLAQRMREQGHTEIASLFSKLGEFSQLHLAETQGRYRDLAGDYVPLVEGMFVWPDHHSPENPTAVDLSGVLDTRAAIGIALSLEREACDFYSGVANQTRDADVQELAQTFAEEESEHVSHLQRWLSRS